VAGGGEGGVMMMRLGEGVAWASTVAVIVWMSAGLIAAMVA
jgi:hypothetical protein